MNENMASCVFNPIKNMKFRDISAGLFLGRGVLTSVLTLSLKKHLEEDRSDQEALFL